MRESGIGYEPASCEGTGALNWSLSFAGGGYVSGPASCTIPIATSGLCLQLALLSSQRLMVMGARSPYGNGVHKQLLTFGYMRAATWEWPVAE